jgi:hypothetical protein
VNSEVQEVMMKEIDPLEWGGNDPYSAYLYSINLDLFQQPLNGHTYCHNGLINHEKATINRGIMYS